MNQLSDALAGFYPPVNDHVRTGQLTVDIAQQAWFRIAADFTPAPCVVILYGSIVEGDAKPYSDIDLALICEHADHVVRRPVAAHGFLFDISRIPRAHIQRMATEAAHSLGPGRITPFLSGIAIAGDALLFQHIKEEVETVYSARNRDQKHLLAGLESNLLGMLTDLCCASDEKISRCKMQEAIFVSLNIVSVRSFHELLPPSLMIKRSSDGLRALILDILNFSLDKRHEFVDFIIRRVGFNEIRGWS